MAHEISATDYTRPGRELNLLVSKTLEIPGVRIENAAQNFFIEEGEAPFWKYDGGYRQEFEPSTDIAAAWEVVKKMRADGYCIVFYDYLQIPTVPNENKFQVSFIGQGIQACVVSSESFELAVCLASLKAFAFSATRRE